MDAGPPMLGNRQRPSKMFLDPAFQTLIAAVGPNQHDAGEQDMEAGKQEHAAWLVVDVGRVDLSFQGFWAQTLEISGTF